MKNEADLLEVASVAPAHAHCHGRDPVGVRPRVILLGTSNLTRGISMAVESARLACGGPVEVVAALGHGRSYGMSSAVLGRKLPGILQCGLWRAVSEAPAAPTAALLTDVGNDLVYGASVGEIAGWIETCLDRLQPSAGARIALTRLPLDSLRTLSTARFQIFRKFFFPSCRLALGDALDLAERAERELERIAAERKLALVAQSGAWFGLDPIHFKRRHFGEAWRCYFSAWQTAAAEAPLARGSLFRWGKLRFSRPESMYAFGREIVRRQPARRLRDGTTLSLY